MAKNVCDAGGRRPAATDLGGGLTELSKNRWPPANARLVTKQPSPLSDVRFARAACRQGLVDCEFRHPCLFRKSSSPFCHRLVFSRRPAKQRRKEPFRLKPRFLPRSWNPCDSRNQNPQNL